MGKFSQLEVHNEEEKVGRFFSKISKDLVCDMTIPS